MFNRRTSLLLFMVAVFCTPTIFAQDEPTEGQPDPSAMPELKFHGTWKLVSLKRDGTDSATTQIDDVRLIFEDSSYTYKSQTGERDQGAFKVNASKKPPTLVTTYAEGPNKGMSLIRLYKWIDADTVKFCSPGPGETQPDNFEAPAGSGREVAVWKRVTE